MKFYTGYEDEAANKKRSSSARTHPVGDSLTVQSDAKDADINVIMERYAKTGLMPAPKRLPSYGDFDGISDYRDAVEAVREADELFMRLPAKVRQRFDNDAGAFVDFCSDEANLPELAELGLLEEGAARAIKETSAKVKGNPTEGKSPDGAPVAAPGRDGDSPGKAAGR